MAALDAHESGPAASLADVLVLFDWNGTLVLDAARARLALNGVLRTRGLPGLDGDDFAARFQLPMAAMFTALGVRPAELADAESEWNAAIAGVAAAARAGLTEALHQLGDAGARLGVVSAASAGAIDADLDRLGIRRWFASIDTGTADKTGTLLLRRGTARRAYYVGDTTYDIACALAAGYVPVGVAGGYTSAPRLLEAGATAIVDDLRDILDVVVDGSAGTPARPRPWRPGIRRG